MSLTACGKRLAVIDPHVIELFDVVKIGTKVRNIRLIDGTGGHDIDCKIDGVGPMQLKSEFVKKA